MQIWVVQVLLLLAQPYNHLEQLIDYIIIRLLLFMTLIWI